MNDSSVTGVKSSPYDILSDIQAFHGRGRAYGEKQLHKVPDAPSVDRVKFILEKCRGKTVLDIGHASGDLHKMICGVAKRTYGLDKNGDGSDDTAVMDLDRFDIPSLPFGRECGIELVVCGEVLEHLSNPGWLLHRIAQSLPDAELLISVPNAFSTGSKKWLAQGIENVNRDHSCWFSYRTLMTLVTRYGFAVNSWAWYNGEPLTAEGLIFVCNACQHERLNDHGDACLDCHRVFADGAWQ